MISIPEQIQTQAIPRRKYYLRQQTPAAPPSSQSSIYWAMKLSEKYRNTPSPLRLMADFGMSRATAYRWVAAFKAARGEA